MAWVLPYGGTANGNGPILIQDRVANSPARSNLREVPSPRELRNHDGASLVATPLGVNPPTGRIFCPACAMDHTAGRLLAVNLG